MSSLLREMPARGCGKCKYLRRSAEEHLGCKFYVFQCLKRPSNENLHTFPFRNGCKEIEI